MTRTKSSNLVVERRALAKILDVSVRHLADLEADGVVIPLRRGRGGRPSRYALEAVVPAYVAHRLAAPTTGLEREARQRRDLATARLTELHIAREQGELVSGATVITTGQAYTAAWASKIRSLPRQLVQAGILPRGQEPGAAALCRHILSEIASWKTPADLQRKTRHQAKAGRTSTLDPQLEPEYVSPAALRRQLADPKSAFSRVPALRQEYERLIAEGRGLVQYRRTGGWQPWPPSQEATGDAAPSSR